ncbi:MAG TPA: BspA family leucine-rich repeat surface protein [Leucothrix sp.]|nr:BspA family leucine-rich repeat surface protein [Leucothrix sp.]
MSSNDTHPEFSWAKVSTSNNYQPSGDTTDITPTFKWGAVLNASSYQFGHEDVNGATRWHDYVLNTQQLSCTTNICSYTPTDITFAIGDKKAWWVRAKVSGAWRSWSSPHVFKVIDNTPLPSLGAQPISPKGEIDTRFPTLKWTSDSNATLYQIGYENQNGTEWSQESVYPSQAYCQSLSCFYRPSHAHFNIGDKKTWWVRSRINNRWGMWSAGANFSIKNTVIPPVNNKAFKIRVDTRKTHLSVTPINQFLISTKGSGYNYSIDCNSDGVFEGTAVTNNYLCRYPVAGVHTVSIVGSFPQIYFDAPASGIPTHKTDARKITEIVQWGDQKWRSMENAFAGAENMTITASDKPDLSQVKNMYRMFWLASKLDQYIGDWDVSGVTNMSDMFGLARIFNQDITGWDVSNVTDMAYMFDEAEKFNQDISVWNMSNVTNTSEMFWGAKVFNQAIGSWDLGKVDNMYNMFYKAESFNQDVSAWNVTSVKPSVTRYYGMEGMFQGANLSSSNYDKLLISWSNQNVQRNIVLSAPSVKYSAVAVAARNKLVNNFGWIIRDAGQL